MEDLKSSIKRLNNQNYGNWKYRMELLLMKEELWEIVKYRKPDVVDVHWESKNNKAKAMIGLLIEDSQLIHVRKLETAHEYWKVLSEYHEKASLSNKVSLLKKLCRLQLNEGDNMEDHLVLMMEIIDKLSIMGEDLADHLVVAFMLSSLPESYSTIVMALETRPDKDLTVELVKEKLIQESKRRNESRFEEQTAMKIKSRTSKVCNYCKRKGHAQDECWFYKKKDERRNTIQKVKKTVNQSESDEEVNDYDDDHDEYDTKNYHVCFKLTPSSKKNSWYIDSAATCHMVCDEYFFEYLDRSSTETIFLADGTKIKSKGIGYGFIELEGENGNVQICKIDNALYVPEIDGNLLSVKKLTENNFIVIFKSNECVIKTESQVIARAKLRNNLYELNIIKKALLTKLPTKCDINLLHKRFGHRNIADIRLLERNQLVDDIKIVGEENREPCEVCLKGKMTRRSFPLKSENRRTGILELFHSDICGPMKTRTPSGNQYILTFIDDYSRYTFLYLLKHKHEAFEKLQELCEMLQTKYNKTIMVLRSDRGGEYTSKVMEKYLKKKGIIHEMTSPYSPEQNGVAERKNRSLTEMAKCMLLEAQLDNKFWGEAVITANYLQNRLPFKICFSTPFELWNNKKPNLSHIKIFGCNAYVFIPKETRKKFDDRSKMMKFVGYSEESKAYRLLDTSTCKIVISRNVTFLENMTSDINDENESLERNKGEVIINIINDEKENKDQNQGSKTIEIQSDTEEEKLTSQEDDNEDNSLRDEIENYDENYFQEDNSKLMTDGKIEVDDAPKTYEEAMKMKNRRKWIHAMEEEIKSMEKCSAWDLVQCPTEKRIIDCKWIYKIKSEPNTSSVRYRARLVARGFSQKYGEDYDEVFAPVVKQTTIRTLLTISGIKNMQVKHLDIKTAYLNGHLEEIVYMKQPKGFEDKEHPEFVCRLKKSIYGLKQSARAWNNKITEVLTAGGFKRGSADSCIFSKKILDNFIYVLIYVDDILIAAYVEQQFEEVEKLLSDNFETKIIGDIKYYLGIEVERNKNGIFYLHQQNYIEKILKFFNLENAKTSKIPLDSGYQNNSNIGKPLENNDLYRKAIGSLLYLSVNTRPDISASISILSRKVNNPNSNDWNEVKRVMKYLKLTKTLKLQLGEKDAENNLEIYADADWAGDDRDRKSTSGFIIKLYSSSISWSSKKQSTVSLSSTEAEYISLCEACQELQWIRQLMKDFNEQSAKITVYEDNQSTLKMLDNEGVKTRSKHIDVKYHYIRELKKKKEVIFEYCPSDRMQADIMTKPLGFIKIQRLRESIGLRN